MRACCDRREPTEGVRPSTGCLGCRGGRGEGWPQYPARPPCGSSSAVLMLARSRSLPKERLLCAGLAASRLWRNGKRPEFFNSRAKSLQWGEGVAMGAFWLFLNKIDFVIIFF